MGIEKIITENNCIEYKLNGNFHREDGPAVIWPDGTKEWWINGKRHKEDGPAFIREDHKEWWINYKRHRIDGPAVTFQNGEKQWWVLDKKLSREDFTSFDMVKRMKAEELFTPVELARLRMGKDA